MARFCILRLRGDSYQFQFNIIDECEKKMYVQQILMRKFFFQEIMNEGNLKDFPDRFINKEF